MPTLGGLLKKRRTRDSQDLSKELQAGSTTTGHTTTSPIAAEESQSQQHHGHHGHHGGHHFFHHNHHNHQASNNTANSANSQNSHAAKHHESDHASAASNQPSDGQTASMQSPAQQPSSTSVHSNSGHHSNAASIHNIINPSQQNTPQVSRTERTTKGKYNLDDFAIQRTLGTGSFGRVHLVQSKHNHRYYAIKVLKKAQVVKMKQIEHTNDERRMLNRVRHPFLVTLWGTWQDARNLYMVMDFVEGGELFSLLRKSQRFPNPVAKFYAAEVTLALEYLHSLNIIYRDLKPENLLLDRHGHLKITDFGFAKEVPDITWTLCGTPDYLAPEVVASKGYNKSVDWWSLGILIFEMLCGFTPFWDQGSPVKIYQNILAGRIKFPPYLHPDAVDLLSRLITSDLTKRLGNLHGGPDDIKNHPWFAEVTWDRLLRKEIDAPYVPPIRGGQGDASQYENYQEESEPYGQTGEDPHGHLFPDF
ncbi:kinase-like domain-containing protein [Aspergillus spinulosporus]